LHRAAATAEAAGVDTAEAMRRVKIVEASAELQ
jgi:hypothetical protein